MTKYINEIAKYARRQNARFNVHPSNYFGVLDIRKFPIIIGDTGQNLDFTLEVSPDFSSQDLDDLPEKFSTLLLNRNKEIHPAKWKIELGSSSKEYFYSCCVSVQHSELSEKTFYESVKLLYLEGEFYSETALNYSKTG